VCPICLFLGRAMDLHGLCSSPCGKAVHGKSVQEGCALLPWEGCVHFGLRALPRLGRTALIQRKPHQSLQAQPL
jgi:hypothetical protein